MQWNNNFWRSKIETTRGTSTVHKSKVYLHSISPCVTWLAAWCHNCSWSSSWASCWRVREEKRVLLVAAKEDLDKELCPRQQAGTSSGHKQHIWLHHVSHGPWPMTPSPAVHDPVNINKQQECIPHTLLVANVTTLCVSLRSYKSQTREVSADCKKHQDYSHMVTLCSHGGSCKTMATSH